MNNSNQLVVITGASKGIGEAIWRRFAAAGHPTVGIARSTDQLADIATQLRKEGYEADYFTADLGSTVRAAGCAKQVVKSFGLPHGVIFNAGTASHKMFANNRPVDRKLEMAINYFGPCAMLDVLLPACAKEGRGHFIAVGSLAAVISFPGNGTYAASKAAIASLWRTLQHEYETLEFSLALPGLTDTELAGAHEGLAPKRSPESVARLVYEMYQKPQIGQTIGIENRLTLLLDRLSPKALDFAVGRLKSYIVPSTGESKERSRR